jgi:hypothetical protein
VLAYKNREVCRDCKAWRDIQPSPSGTWRSRWRRVHQPETRLPQPLANYLDDLDPVSALFARGRDASGDGDKREMALIKLLFSAKRLAESRVPSNYCSQCGAIGERGLIAHAEICDAGQVLAAIVTLSGLDLSDAVCEEDAAASEVGLRYRDDHGEPWRAENPGSGSRRILDCVGTMIARTMSASPRENSDWANRIIACVNFCAGIETARLTVSVPLADMGADSREGVEGLLTLKGGAR